MNLESHHCGRFLQPKVIPLLLLIHEWGKDGQKALIRTDAIILLLESLHLMLSKKTKKKLTLSSLCKQVQKVMKKESDLFLQSLHDTAANGYHLINILKELNSLIEPSKGVEFSVPLIDRKNGVLGVFLKRCLQEYQRLTFSQVKLLHSKWKAFYEGPHDISLNITKTTDKERISQAKRERNTTLGLKTLMFSDSKNESVSVELKALHLAMLLAHFNHTEESSLALSEAIRLAQSNENDLVLEHSLALLQQLTPVPNRDTQVLITEFIKNAQQHDQQLLVSTGKLQLANLSLLMKPDPKQVLLLISASQLDAFNSNEKASHKIAIRSSALLSQAKLLHQFGCPLLSQLPLQLLCHMMSHDQNHTPHRISDLAKAIHFMAKLLHNKGQTHLAIDLLTTGLNHLKSHDITGNVTEPIQCTLAEISIEQGLDRKEYHLVRDNITKLKPFDSLLAVYWNASLLVNQYQYDIAMKECDTILQLLEDRKPNYEIWTLQAKVMLLQGHVLYCEGRLSDAIELLMKTLILCKEHCLISLYIPASLYLAQCQLGLHFIDSCSRTLHNIMPSVMNNDVSKWKMFAYQLLAEVTIISSSLQTKGQMNQITPKDCQKALQYLNFAQLELQNHTPHSTLTTLSKYILVLKNSIAKQWNIE